MASPRTAKRKAQRRAAKYRRLHPSRYTPDAMRILSRIVADYYVREVVEQLHNTADLYDRLTRRP